MSHNERATNESDVKVGKTIIPGEWIWRVVCFLLLVANLWAKVNYVSVADYREDQKQAALTAASQAASIVKIESLLTKIQEENKVNDRQEESLRDHEVRLRNLERVPLTKTR